MIRILDCKNPNYLSRLKLILNKRRFKSKINTDIVIKIVKDIKKNKQKALLKYEKKFSKNNKIKTSKNEINKSIKSLNPKIKKAIDFAYSRILKFHSLQKINNKNILFFFRNFISSTFTFASEQHAEITCIPFGSLAMIFARYFFSFI